MGQSLSRLQDRQSTRALRELAPQKTPGHDNALPQLSRDTLLRAMQNVASSIVKTNQDLTVIAIGGDVNTVHLRSRQATHDLDFFNDNLTASDFEVLIKAAKEATKKDKNLSEDWFNNRTIFFIPKDKRSVLTEAALRQREVIFMAPGLTVLAAPWQYSFCCKLDRLAGGGLHSARHYDLDDAVEYLHQYMTTNNVTQIPKDTVQGWFEQYSLRWTKNNDDFLEQIGTKHQAKFSTNPIIISV